MNIDTLTPDEFMKLDPADHAVAISVYSQRIMLLEKKAKRPESADALEIMLDECRRCQNLRKLHVLAIHAQLVQPEENEAPAAAAA